MAMFAEYPQSYFDNIYGRTNYSMIRRVDMHNTSGNSDKVYIIIVFQDKFTGIYTTEGFWGRRGHSLSQKTYYSGASITQANDELYALMNKKRKGGYRIVYDHDTTSQPQAAPKLKPTSDEEKIKRFYQQEIPKIEHPTFDYMPPKEADPYIKKREYAIEVVPNMHPHFLALEDEYWYVFKPDGSFVEKFENTYDLLKIKASFDSSLLSGFKDINGHYVITDLLKVEHELVVKKPWKVRRAMLTYMFGELNPPGMDSYDSSLPVYLSSYHYDNKEQVFQTLKGIVVFRHIDRKYQYMMNVTTK